MAPIISSYCHQGGCCSITPVDDGVIVSSTVRDGSVFFSDDEWIAFIAGVKDSEFDLATLRCESESM